MQTVQAPQMTPKQEKYIVDLAAQRPGWLKILQGNDFEVVTDVLVNVQIKRDAEQSGTAPAGLKMIALKHASHAIGALLGVRPPTAPVQPGPKVAPVAQVAAPTPSPFQRLQVLLTVLPLSKSVRFAVEVDGELRFYAVDRRVKNGETTRWVNQLLGAPGGWNRKKLPIHEQIKIARLIMADWEAAAKAYSTKHGHCFRCDAYLSDKRSRAANAGWNCAKALGWPW